MPDESLHSYPALCTRFAPAPFVEVLVPDAVKAFFVTAANLLGRQASAEFQDEIYIGCHDIRVTSPIEQLLLCALATLANANLFLDDYHHNDGPGADEIVIIPQKRIGRYRVDFEVQLHCGEKEPRLKRSVLVECDSQQFHDRTEKERRAEKTRDRFLQSSGYKVFRFTGKEITEDPFLVAAEIIALVVCAPTENVYEWCKEHGYAK